MSYLRHPLIGALSLLLLAAGGCGDNDNRPTATPRATPTPSAAPTTCPRAIELHVEGAGVDLDLGWTGIGYDVPLHEGIVLPLQAECASSGSDCGTCVLTASSTVPDERDRRRCAHDVRQVCSADRDCESGPCVPLLGPPLALTTGGVASCTRNEIAAIGSGVYDPTSGSMTLPLTLRWTFYAGIDVGVPCPRCSGATLGAVGVCESGLHDGESCIVDATDALFGNASYDCSPNPGAELGFFDLPMQLTTASSRLEPTEQCAGTGAGDPHCLCPGQTTANFCDDGTCDLGTDGDAMCRIGPIDGLCRHERFRGCLDDADCPATGDYCAFAKRECSSEAVSAGGNIAPLERGGTPDSARPILVSTFCVAAANSAVPNQGLGLPGPAAIRLPVRVVVRP